MDRERLIQEEHVDKEDGPWRVLIVCVCLNQTSYYQVDRIIDQLFGRWPNAKAMSDADVSDVINLIRPLGLYDTRGPRMIRISDDYIRFRDMFGSRYDMYPVGSMMGVGQYASDAWRLFVLRDACNPKDGRLRWYAERVGLLSDE